MHTTRFLPSRGRLIVPLICGFCLSAVVCLAAPAKAVPASPVMPTKTAFEEAPFDQSAAERSGLWLIAKPVPLAKRVVFENAVLDPLAAERAGLWVNARRIPTPKRVAFEEAVIDPLAAERDGLWAIDVSAGHGHTKIN